MMLVKPFKEDTHFIVNMRRIRSLEMDFFFPHWTRDNLPRTACILSPICHPYSVFLAIEDRTWSGLKNSPSISEDFKTSWVKVSKNASFLKTKPNDSILPKSLPCIFLASLSRDTNYSMHLVLITVITAMIMVVIRRKLRNSDGRNVLCVTSYMLLGGIIFPNSTQKPLRV